MFVSYLVLGIRKDCEAGCPKMVKKNKCLMSVS